VKLFTHALSPFSAKVRIALDEKSLAFEEIALPIRRSGIVHKPPALFEANPRGEVPALVDGELRLHDSTVILEYLEERRPEPALYPRDVGARARARLLEDTADWMLDHAVADLLAETYRKPDESLRDPARLEAAAAAVRRTYDRLEAELGEGEHFVGAFGVADLALYLPVSFGAFFGVGPAGTHPKLAAWLDRVAGRPSIARETAAMGEALAKLED
jgi:glutathione S-transferase